MRKKTKTARVEPSRASIPRGQYFAFRITEPLDLSGYIVHWTFNGQRIPRAHKPELGFYHMRPRFDGEYRALLVRGSEVIASNVVCLKTIGHEAQAELTLEYAETPEVEWVFDPTAPEAEPLILPADDKKKAFLAKALKKTKKAA